MKQKLLMTLALTTGLINGSQLLAGGTEETAAAEKAQQALEMQQRELQLATDELHQAQAAKQKELAELQKQMLNAQRELRDASKEAARVRRDMARAERDIARREGRNNREIRRIEVIGAPGHGVIGIIMGGTTDNNGVKIIGLTPDGPAEKAGIRQDDVIIAINGQQIAGSDGAGAQLIRDVMLDVKPGDEVELEYQRDGKSHTVTLAAAERLPLALHSLMPDIPALGQIKIIKNLDIPNIEIEDLEGKISELEERLKDGDWAFGEPHFIVKAGPDFEFEVDQFSDLASEAFDNAFVWFGSRLWHDLELSPMNDDLANYFDTSEGVLVVRAGEDNGLNLKSGDVILEIAGNPVSNPTEVMRALRDVEDNQELDLSIMRRGKREDYSVLVPQRDDTFSWRYKVKTK